MAQHQGGRPIKKVAKGERTQIGVIIGGKTKSLLLKAMKESGRTISREVEHLVEKALAYDDLLAVLNNIASGVKTAAEANGDCDTRRANRPKNRPTDLTDET